MISSSTFLPPNFSKNISNQLTLRHLNNLQVYKKGVIYNQKSSFLTKLFAAKQLRELEIEANRAPQNAVKQFRYIRELNKYSPAAVINRVENSGGKLAISEGIVKEYVKALSTTGKIDRIDLRGVVSPLFGNELQNIMAESLNHQSSASSSLSTLSTLNRDKKKSSSALESGLLNKASSSTSGSLGVGLDRVANSSSNSHSEFHYPNPYGITNQTGAVTGALGGSSGMDPSTPLYVSAVKPSVKQELWKTFRHAVLLFLII